MEVWGTLGTHWEVVAIWAIGTHKDFQTCSIKGYSVFKALLALDSFNTWIKFAFALAA